MNQSFPTPMDLNEIPELGALRILETSLEVAKRALVAAYPRLGSGEAYSEHCHTLREVYANSILLQSCTLTTMLRIYEDSVRRPEATAEDISF